MATIHFKRFGSRLSYIIALNQLRGSTFDLFEKSPEKAQAMELQVAADRQKLLDLSFLGRQTQTRLAVSIG